MMYGGGMIEQITSWTATEDADTIFYNNWIKTLSCGMLP
jgi:hypothetical protein